MRNRLRNALRALLGRPTVILRDGATLSNVTFHGVQRVEGVGVIVRSALFMG